MQTTQFLTENEKTRIVGLMAESIADGRTPLVNVDGLKNPVEMALKELEEGKCPFLIERPISRTYKISHTVRANDLIKQN